MKKKIILDLCGGTGAWSKPYKDKGYDVRNITWPRYDVRLYEPPKNVYGILAAPPCTMFSFARTNANTSRNLHEGMAIVLGCLRIIWTCQYQYKSEQQRTSPLKFWALENPNGWLKFFLGYPVFEFDPWEFGDMYTKKTQLWGYFNKPKKTHFIKPKTKKFDRLLMNELTEVKRKDLKSIGDIVYKDRNTRATIRSITPQGFANAFYEANK